MSFFRNVVFLAAIAGLLAGLALAVMQTFTTVPLILQAETFENGAVPAHDHGAAAEQPAAGQDAAAVETAEHEEEGWAPADGMERTSFTFLANLVTGVGFALVLVAVSELAGGIAGWRNGLVWGFAGFAVFTLAPGLGLPPELPAMPAADLAARQAWWIATVAATGVGLWLIAFRSSPIMAVVGLALIVLPHIIGAPQPVSHESPIPPDLHHRFIVAVTVTNLLFWMVLGAAVGVFRERFLGAAEALRPRIA
ncbi:MAG: CbtA family protein [Rhizobiaceae bacterium]|nr:CbtA family protein [Rhizobiaceae bacterium]